MRRREFIAGLGGAFALPFAARAQSAPDRMPRIGVLMARNETDAEAQKQLAALRQGLRDAGWRVGQSLQADVRWSVGDSAKALAAARELIALNPDLLVANATPSLVAFRSSRTRSRSCSYRSPTRWGKASYPAWRGRAAT
jgi:putative tryptophan/tyrosine transport system substrate-binding protein